MELDDPSQASSLPRGAEGTNKQNGERNLATRRHTVGPSDTAHDQVMGKHLKLTHSGARGPPRFYPSPGVSSLRYSPLNLPSHIAYNPSIGLNPIDQSRLGLMPNVDLTQRPTSVTDPAVNSELSPESCCQNPNLFHGRIGFVVFQSLV